LNSWAFAPGAATHSIASPAISGINFRFIFGWF
jgi:hypothetical protein